MISTSTGQRATLHAKKQEVVRQEIWSAAIDLFNERTFDEVTIDQIAARAGVSRRTFFRYFASKEDVMASNVRDYGNAIVEAIRAQKKHLSGFEVAKAVLKSVLTPHLTIAQRVSLVASRSSAALAAQFLEVPQLEKSLTAAFAARRGDDLQRSLEDRILAKLTLSITGLSVELWLADPVQSMPEVVERVCLAFSGFSAAHRSRRRKRASNVPLKALD